MAHTRGADIARFYKDLVDVAPSVPRWSLESTTVQQQQSQQQHAVEQEAAASQGQPVGLVSLQGPGNVAAAPRCPEPTSHLRPVRFRSSGVHDMSVPAISTLAPSAPHRTSRQRPGSGGSGPGPPRLTPGSAHALAAAEALLDAQWQAAQAAFSAKEAAAASRALELNEDNVGFRLLKASGWTVGRGLGVREQGPVAPLQPGRNPGNQGIGFMHGGGSGQVQAAAGGHRREGSGRPSGKGDGSAAQDGGQAAQKAGRAAKKRARSSMQAVEDELAGESLQEKLALHRAVMHAEEDAAHTRALSAALRRAFDDPFDNGGGTTADMNPVGRRTRLTSTNPLLDDEEDDRNAGVR